MHPKIAASIAADTHPFSFGKTLCLTEEGDLLSCLLTEASAATVPQGAYLQKKSMRARTACAYRSGERAKRETAAS